MGEIDGGYDIETDSIMFPSGEEFNIAAIGKEQMPWWNRFCVPSTMPGLASA